MVRSAIAIGSNLGDRAGHLQAATEALGSLGDIVAESPVYETAPVGGPDQGAYLNSVIVLDTPLEPRQLLDALLSIELERGRERTDKWGPRTLDLDILLYGSQTVAEPGLAVPHPRMIERRFVLDPLLDVWSDAALPDGTPLRTFRDSVSEQDVTRFVDESSFRPWTALAVFLIFNVAAVLIWRFIALF